MAAPATAVLKVVPASGTVTVGDTFFIDLKVDTGGQEVGAVHEEVSYSSNLAYVSYADNSSDFPTELSAPDPSDNRFALDRIRLSDGYNGSNGEIIQVQFRATGSGTGYVTIDGSNSQVIAYSDSSDILLSTSNGSYTLRDSSGTSQSTPTPSTSSTATTAPKTSGATTGSTKKSDKSLIDNVKGLLKKPSASPSIDPVSSPAIDDGVSASNPKSHLFYITDLSPTRAVLYRQLSILAGVTRTIGLIAGVVIASLSLIAIWFTIVEDYQTTRLPK